MMEEIVVLLVAVVAMVLPEYVLRVGDPQALGVVYPPFGLGDVSSGVVIFVAFFFFELYINLLNKITSSLLVLTHI